MSVWGRRRANARHWTACCRRSPERGRCKSQSAWSGRNGWVLKTTSRASTPRRRSVCTFVQATPPMLTGQWVTRRAIGPEVSSAGREQEADLVPARDLAAVGTREAGIDGFSAEGPLDLGHLRAAVDLRACDAFRNRCERLVEGGQAATGPGRIGERPRGRTAERPQLRGRPLPAGRDRDLERGLGNPGGGPGAARVVAAARDGDRCED